ncbi:CPA1 family monovalent cation:H+ antiporter [Crossiella equi]|uniref:CPA1 family monovalent cation:H+ antiporter n=1 Tax=Crossiella equi TaxID=130796 RepID=A0ABS5A6F2_9PSEU|nr:Na+/H+ antiporter [Crossiella equi]MBP2472174.1 CPA1 family monovalent cation:H+ antiporter [Crossiella equi]
MQIAVEIIGLVVAVLAVAFLAHRLNMSAPLLLIVAGIVASFIPGVPDYVLNPDVVLFGLLPPLLYATAIRTSLVDFRANRGPIGLLSVGLVIFSTFGVGIVAWLALPGVPLAAAIALGAVVAPPDAVAATAVARRVGMPRTIVRVLEGESLVNDAAALVALRTATAAMAGAVSFWQVGGNFLLAAGAGVLAGLLIGWLSAFVRTRLNDAVFDTGMSLVVPYLAYLAAEAVHGSGVLAVVIAGLMLGHKEPRMLNGASRIAGTVNWQTIQFLLENAVFLLIGLQLRRILAEVGETDVPIPTVVLACTLVLLATILTRVLWMAGITLLRKAFRLRAWRWRYTAVTAWAGMRGVVTLAAVFVLPEDTPQRPVLVLAAFVVVAGTLFLQGGTLPWLVRRLRLPAPDPAQDALQEATLLQKMTKAGLDRLEEERRPEDTQEVLDRLRTRLNNRTNAAWEALGRSVDDLETPSFAYRRLRRSMLEAEMETLLAARDSRAADDVVLRRVMDTLAIEESMLDRSVTVAASDPETTGWLRPKTTSEVCKHLKSAPYHVPALSEEGCQDCLVEGTTWVHLRLCLTCGHVGCCDSSPAQHATRHFREEQHPVMRSFEPGEKWRWCFVHGVVG